MAIKNQSGKKAIPVWRKPEQQERKEGDYLELSGNLAGIHFKEGLETVYPRLVAYEGDLKEKIARLNQELTHVQAQIAGIERILETRND